MNRTYDELVAIFKRLGAVHPEARARAEVSGGSPELASYLFLRRAWDRAVIREDDPAWTGLRAQPPGQTPDEPEHSDKPGGGYGAALNRILCKGVNPEDLVEVIRILQYESLFGLCYLLGDIGDVEPDLKDVAWALFEVDAEGNPVRPMHGLHESVLSMDPTGREMRPRKRSAP